MTSVPSSLVLLCTLVERLQQENWTSQVLRGPVLDQTNRKLLVIRFHINLHHGELILSATHIVNDLGLFSIQIVVDLRSEV